MQLQFSTELFQFCIVFCRRTIFLNLIWRLSASLFVPLSHYSVSNSVCCCCVTFFDLNAQVQDSVTSFKSTHTLKAHITLFKDFFVCAVLGRATFPTFVLSLYGSDNNFVIHPLGHCHASLISVAVVFPPSAHNFLVR